MEFGLWYIAVFALTGALLAARLGIGTGVILAPVLIMTPGVNTREALLAALLAEVFVQAASLLGNDRTQAVDTKTVRALAPFAISAGIVGSALVGMFGDTFIKLLIGLAVGAVGASFVAELDSDEEDAQIALGRGLVEPSEDRELEAFGENFAYSVTRLDEGQMVAIGGGMATGLFGCGQIAVHRQSLLRRQRVPSVITTASALMIGLLTAIGGAVTQMAFAVNGDSGLGHLGSMMMFIIAGSAVGVIGSTRLPPARWDLLLKGLGVALILLGCLTITNGLFR